MVRHVYPYVEVDSIDDMPRNWGHFGVIWSASGRDPIAQGWIFMLHIDSEH